MSERYSRRKVSVFVIWIVDVFFQPITKITMALLSTVILFSCRSSSCALIVCAIYAAHCSAQQFTPFVAKSDSECALLLEGPGRTSAFDYNPNAHRGTSWVFNELASMQTRILFSICLPSYTFPLYPSSIYKSSWTPAGKRLGAHNEHFLHPNPCYFKIKLNWKYGICLL